jgi:eukaryotic-like serine/threonine-protein kinase
MFRALQASKVGPEATTVPFRSVAFGLGAPGTRLHNRYELIAYLGEGAMAVVWRARDLTAHEDVAVKIPRSDDAISQLRMQREGELAALIDSPYVVAVRRTHASADGDPGCMVTECVDGQTLDAYLRSESVERPRLLTIAYELGLALAAAHDKSIVHRDLKPNNIVLAPDCIRVLDFGVARSLLETSPTEVALCTATGTLLGTPGYMAPEQFESARGVDERADLWAVGVILFRMFTGSMPFPVRSYSAVVSAGFDHRPLAAKLASSAAPAAVQQLCLQLLQRERAARPRSARVVAECLRSACDELRI